MMDVDFFKRYNDSYGHQAGDACLQAVARAVQQATQRTTDLVARYGGEEFVALLPEADLDKAEAAAERIRSLFARCAIMPAPDQEVTCTASIGVTTFVAGESPRDFVARADSGTYEAKRQGKNRVIRIPPPAAAA